MKLILLIILIIIIVYFSYSSFKATGSRFSATVSTGPIGPIGPQGPIGKTGAIGPQGIAGTAGKIGIQGIPGAAGTAGTAGAAGKIGIQGTAGAPGLMGPAGSPGLTGIAGAAGKIGASGSPGIAGAAGLMGPHGSSGPPGSSGLMGPQGSSGLMGPPGPQMFCFQNNNTGTVDCSNTPPSNVRYVQTGSSSKNIPLNSYMNQFKILSTNLNNNMNQLIKDTCSDPNVMNDTINILQSSLQLGTTGNGQINTNDLINKIRNAASSSNGQVFQGFYNYISTLINPNIIITQQQINDYISTYVNDLCDKRKKNLKLDSSSSSSQMLKDAFDNIMYTAFANNETFTSDQMQQFQNIYYQFQNGSINTVEVVINALNQISPIFSNPVYTTAANIPASDYLPNVMLNQQQFNNFITSLANGGSPIQFIQQLQQMVTTFPVSGYTIMQLTAMDNSSKPDLSSSGLYQDLKINSSTIKSSFGGGILLNSPSITLKNAIRDLCQNPNLQNYINQLTNWVTSQMQDPQQLSVNDLNNMMSSQISYTNISGFTQRQNSDIQTTLKTLFNDLYVLIADQNGMVSANSLNKFINSLPQICTMSKSNTGSMKSNFGSMGSIFPIIKPSVTLSKK